MSVSRVSEQFRAELRARLEQIISGGKPNEVLQAEKIIAQHVERITNARESMLRLDKGLPRRDICPRCYYLHDRVVDLVAAATADGASGRVRWQCGSCRYYEDRKV